MVNLRAFILVMSVIGLRHALVNAELVPVGVSGLSEPSDSRVYPDMLIASCVLFCVLGKFLAVMTALHADLAGPASGWRRFTYGRNLLEWAWIAVQAAVWPTSQVAACLVNLEVHGAWPCWIVLVWFLPSFIFLGVLEYCCVELDRDMSRARHCRAGHSPIGWWDRIRLGITGQVLTCVVPMWCVLAIHDCLGLVAPAIGETWRLCVALAGLAALCLVLAPWWMRLAIGARPLAAADPLNLRLRDLCQQWKIRQPQLLIVDPKGHWSGAALVGWTPLFRQLWLGQSLLTKLSPAQLDMVILHELAHLKRGHCWWRLLPMAAAASVGTWIVSEGSRYGWRADQPWLILLAAAAMAWSLGWISRRCELDADRVACRHATLYCPWTKHRSANAVLELTNALAALHDPDRPIESSHWLHPSLKVRVSTLTGG